MRYICHVLFMGCCFLSPVTVEAQQIAPLPPTHHVAWMNQDGPSEAQAEADVGGEDEGDLSFLDKDLSEISRTQVTSPALSSDIETVSRTTQPLARTAAAVYVVTNEMIKRCGARNIPEVLRTVPGVDVARINGTCWAISIRGFNARFSNKLLVQIDGIAIYNPTHSGVFWEREYVMIEDVDRIEIIRGPGAAVWGVNAVNGVINIVTKSSKDTKGIYIDGGGGNEHLQFGDFRVGSQNGNLYWRVYGTGFKNDQGYVPPPAVAVDSLPLNQGGFRADWTPNCRDTITFQGDFYSGIDTQSGWVIPPATPATMYCKETRFLTRWVREVDEETDWAVQLYYWNPFAEGANFINTAAFDLDFQHHMKRGRHDIVWGFGYRNYAEDFVFSGAGFTFSMFDSEQIPSYFVQDTITLVKDRLYATFGSKFDHNSVTNFEYQPMAQVAWTPDERTSIWGSIGRAVRTPSLILRNQSTVCNSEDMLSYQMGVRRQPTDSLFWELAVFFNRYDNLWGGMSGPFIIPENIGSADTYGFELNANYEINPRWRLTGSYSFFIEDFYFPAGYASSDLQGSAPRNMAYFQSGWDIGHNVTLDVMFRYVDSLAIGVDSYFVGDIRLAWRPRPNLELSVVGQNLLDGGHYEFVTDSIANPTEVEPGVYGMVSWRY